MKTNGWLSTRGLMKVLSTPMGKWFLLWLLLVGTLLLSILAFRLNRIEHGDWNSASVAKRCPNPLPKSLRGRLVPSSFQRRSRLCSDIRASIGAKDTVSTAPMLSHLQ
jgi:hypothetical protein